MAEWFADARGAELLGQAFAATAAGESGPVAGLLADPGFMRFLGSLPLSRMAAFPGSPLTAETLEKLVAAANG